MARVNVEESFLSKSRRILDYLEKEISITEAEIIGSMVLLWHNTQDLGISEITIQDFSVYTGMAIEGSKHLVEALVRFGVLSTNNDKLIINGNRKHIVNLLELKRKAVKGGLNSGRSRRNKNNNLTVEPYASKKSNPAVQKIEPNALQCITMQFNTKHKNTNTCAFDFDSLYQKYPRKLGKTAGLIKARAQIKSQAEYDDLSLAIEKYSEYITREKTEPQFIKHFSTFMTSWRDWLDTGVGAALDAKKLSDDKLMRELEMIEKGEM